MPYVVESQFTGDTNWDILIDSVYAEVSDAQADADKNNEYYTNSYQRVSMPPPYVFRVREISIDDPIAWRLKVKGQIEAGELVKVPWEMDHHIEHLDPDKPTMVRFIRDSKDAQRFRFTSMAVGRYLTRYRDYSQDQIEKYCALVGLDMTVSKLQMSKSPDEFERVYLNGPHSCMAYEARHGRYGEENLHPVRLYGDLDLAVGYITRGEDIVARTLLWPEKKIYGRIYGDANRIRLRLEEEGYVENWDFTGARLHLERNKYDEIRAPYVDGDLNGLISECGKYIVLSKDEGNIVLESDSGIIYTDKCYECSTTESRLEWYDSQEAYLCSDCGNSQDND